MPTNRRQPSPVRRAKVLMQDPPEQALLDAAEAARYVSSPYQPMSRQSGDDRPEG